MKKLIACWTNLFITAFLYGQDAKMNDPVHLAYSVKQINARQFELHVVATMEDGWHIYSQVQPLEAISVPTQLLLTKNPLLMLKGKPTEIGKKEKFENKVMSIVQYQYEHRLELIQVLQVKTVVKTNIMGTVTYQACTSEMCLPAKTVPFEMTIPEE